MKFFIIWNVVVYGLGWVTGFLPWWMFQAIPSTWALGDSWAPLHWLAGFYVLLLLIPFGVSIKGLSDEIEKQRRK